MALIFFFGMTGGLWITRLKCSILNYMPIQVTRKLAFLMFCAIEGGNDRSWNLRFYRDFHDRELETAFSFLDFIQSRIPRGVRCDSPHWCLNGNGKFDIRSYYNKIRGASISSFPWKGIWGKLRFLKGWPSFCGQQFIVGFLFWIISCLRVSLWQIGVVCVALMRNLWIISSSIVL